MGAEAFTPTFGVLGIGGAIAFAIGAAILIDTTIPTFRIAWPVIATVAAASLILTVVIARLALAVHRRGVVIGRAEIFGDPSVVASCRGARGHVLAHGARWKAQGQQPRTAELRE